LDSFTVQAMAKYLLVAHQTAQAPELLEAAKNLAAADAQAEFSLLVPATPVGNLLVWEEGETMDVARSTARSGADSLKRHGINIVGVKVGDADPVLAIEDALRDQPFETIVLSTLPIGISRWLKMDVVSRLRRQHPALRVLHVIAEPTPKPKPKPAPS
jgi:hypothetical protein